MMQVYDFLEGRSSFSSYTGTSAGGGGDDLPVAAMGQTASGIHLMLCHSARL